MDRAITLTAAEVRAVLAGTKTQKRVALKPQPERNSAGLWVWPPYDARITRRTWRGFCQTDEDGGLTSFFSGQHKAMEALPARPGDRLWCRETWAHYHTVNHIRRSHGGAFDEVSDGLAGYRADGHDTIEDFHTHVRLMSGLDLEAVIINGDCWRPSVHMPRWASRITLHVTDVRVERLQAISEVDAEAEGVSAVYDRFFRHDNASPTTVFSALWDSMNARRPGCAWDDNPWIVALTFRAVTRNIDAGA